MKHTGLTKAQYAAALAREQAAARAKPGDILAALAAECVGETLRPDDVTIARVRAALPAGAIRSDSTIRRTIGARVTAGELIVIPRCFDSAVGRYVTAYRAPVLPPVSAPVRSMICPHCHASTPRTPPVCAECGGDTRRRKG